MTHKCTNCKWEGEEPVGPLNYCPVCGDNTTSDAITSPKINDNKKEEVNVLEVNNVDETKSKEDSSIIKKTSQSQKSKKKK